MTKLWPLKCILKGYNYRIIKKKILVIFFFFFLFHFFPLGRCENDGRWFRQETSSVQFSHSVISNSLQPHGMQHEMPPYPSSTPKACSNSSPSSWWCKPSHPLSTSSPPAFNLSQHQHLLQWVISSYQVAKVLELQHKSFQLIFRTELIYDWLVWSPCSPRDSQDISPTPRFESVKFLALSFPYSPTLTFKHDFWKNHSFDYVDFCWQVMSLFFTMLSLLVISSIPRSKHLLISWLKSPYAVILEPLKVKSVTVSIVYPIYLPWSNGTPERMKG